MPSMPRPPLQALALGALFTLPLWSGCLEPETFTVGGAPRADEGLGQAWEQESSYSPTGTTLLPSADGLGYAIVDEACGGDRTGAAYAERFRTPMFRDVAAAGETGIAWLVDGSLLWTLDTTADGGPERLALQELPGHPVALHAAAGWLWVATLDAGLRGYPIGGDGLVDTSHGVIALEPTPGRQVMDIDGVGSVLFVALGAEGLAAVRLDHDGEPVETHITPAAGPFVTAVRADESHVVTAACERVQAFTWTGDEPRAAGARGALGLDLVADFAMPFGAAKGVELVGDVIYVSGGEALLAFRLDADGPRYLGYWYSDEPGFYVNETVSDDAGMLYVAAGDQSVRAIDTTTVPLLDGAPVQEPDAAVDLEGPSEAQALTGEVHMVPKDPIAIDRVGDKLFVLGNFRYLGERTLELVDVTIPGFLQPDTSYVQPNVGVASSRVGDQLVVHGSDGVHRVIDVERAEPAVVATFQYSAPLRGTARSGADLLLVPEIGPVVRAAAQGGVVSTLDGTTEPWGVASQGGRTWVADAHQDAIVGYDDASGQILARLHDPSSFLGEAELAVRGDILLAYDRILGQIVTFDLAGEAPAARDHVAVGVCEAYDIADLYSGASHAKAAFLDTATPALLCPRTAGGTAVLLRLDLEPTGELSVAAEVALPSRVWADAAGAGERLTLVAFDNNAYRTDVVTVDLVSGDLLAERSFLGHGNAVELLSGRAWIVDGDHGVWSLSRDLTPLGGALGL